MLKPVIAIKTSVRNYSGLVNLGNRVFSSMTGSLDFVTPVPALSLVQTNITAVVNAIGLWGPKGNRGSHDDLMNLRQQAITLSQTLIALAQYVQNTAQIAAGSDYVEMATKITGSGFQLKGAKNPQDVLQMVQNYRQFVSRKLTANQVKLRWKKPLNTTSAGNVKNYRVFRGTTNVLSAAVEIAGTTKTSFIDINTTNAPITWSYWIVAVGAAGNGVPSSDVTVTVLGV